MDLGSKVVNKNLKEKMDIMRKHGNNKNKPNGNFKLRSTISKVKFFLTRLISDQRLKKRELVNQRRAIEILKNREKRDFEH